MAQPMPTVAEITAMTAEYFGLPAEVIASTENRSYEVTYARHMAQYLARKLTYKSLRVIATDFSMKDHTGVLYAVNKISERLAFDHAGTGDDVRQIEAMIGAKRKPKKGG